MNMKFASLFIMLALSPFTLKPASAQTVPAVSDVSENSISVGNKHLHRSISIKGGLCTSVVVNKANGQKLVPTETYAFVLHLADGTRITSSDFEITDVQETKSGNSVSVTVLLSCTKISLTATLRYSLAADDFYTRKHLTLTPGTDLAVQKIELESFNLADAYQPYTSSQITSRGAAKWRPGLGQPLYTRVSGTFWGVEFPASINTVKDGRLVCAYFVGKTLPAAETYTAHSSVLGVSDFPDFVKDAFFEYIDRTRIRPLRLQTQYNSWFDYGRGVTAERFAASVDEIHDQLVLQRAVPPLRAYVVDDGWQDVGADWSTKPWVVNGKFDSSFANAHKVTANAKSSLGLWLSPGCLFGAQSAIPKMRAAGFRSLDPWMSMSDPAYMAKLEDRMVELANQGVGYFKLDGVFGHLNTRNFDVAGFKGSEPELNDPQHDPEKIQYLTAGSDRLIRLFAAVAQAKPDVYIVISNGAWLSPWWLQHIDAVWMINAGDAAGGSDRTGELVYRDHKYHELAVTDNTQFPLHSIFNHEPKKTRSHETKDTFRRYLYMNMSRGTGFVELYIKPFALKDYDWDVLAEGLHWAHQMFPTFKRSRMHGGNPSAHEVYGYTAWHPEQGYISIHNPSLESKSYTIKLNRKFGLHPDSQNTSFLLSSPITDCTRGLNASYAYGDTLRINLEPKEIRILNFDVRKRDWKTLTNLQTRTKADFVPPKPVPVEGHAILGTWTYDVHTREFKDNGTCTLRSNDNVQWVKPFKATSPTSVVVEGKYNHQIQPDGTLNIEGRYRATKMKEDQRIKVNE